MTKLLNLDDLAAVERSVKWKGKSYKIDDLPVLEYVTAQKAAQDAQAAMTKNDMAGVVKSASEVIKAAVPKFPIEEVGKMNHRQIIAFISLVFDAYPDPTDEVKTATPEGAETGNV